MRLAYLHGFASSPASTKAVAFANHFAARGIVVDRVDCRQPSLAELRLSAILAQVERTLAGEAGPVVLFGSSLGGLVAARHAERDPRVVGLVLMAPAFQLATRWRERLGEAGWQAWRATGWLAVHDYATGADLQLHAGFIDDALVVDPPDTFPTLTMPTLIVHGTADDVVDIAQSRALVARTPTARLIEVDDGHELRASLPLILAEADHFVAGRMP